MRGMPPASAAIPAPGIITSVSTTSGRNDSIWSRVWVAQGTATGIQSAIVLLIIKRSGIAFRSGNAPASFAQDPASGETTSQPTAENCVSIGLLRGAPG